MFERCTVAVRRTILAARNEAGQFGSTTIETEYLLLGLIETEKNVVDHFLGGFLSTDVREEVERRTTIREKITPSTETVLSQECKHILRYASEEADRLSHRHIGIEHLLLGILHLETCLAAQILHERGFRLDAIREKLARAAMPQDENMSGTDVMSMPSYVLPVADIVPDANTAKRIAEAVWTPQYADVIKSQRPLHVELKHGVIWVVTGSPTQASVGALHALINKADGRILAVGRGPSDGSMHGGQEMLAAVKQELYTDAETGLHNKRFLLALLKDELALPESDRHALTLLLVDVDYFKLLHDTYGQVTAKDILKLIAAILSSSLTREDFVFRCGWAEFAILLPKRDLKAGLRIAEQIRSSIETDLVGAIISPTKVTVSVGICEYEAQLGVETFLNRANQALHKAKLGGKNRVHSYPREGSS